MFYVRSVKALGATNGAAMYLIARVGLGVLGAERVAGVELGQAPLGCSLSALRGSFAIKRRYSPRSVGLTWLMSKVKFCNVFCATTEADSAAKTMWERMLTETADQKWTVARMMRNKQEEDAE